MDVLFVPCPLRRSRSITFLLHDNLGTWVYDMGESCSTALFHVITSSCLQKAQLKTPRRCCGPSATSARTKPGFPSSLSPLLWSLEKGRKRVLY